MKKLHLLCIILTSFGSILTSPLLASTFCEETDNVFIALGCLPVNVVATRLTWMRGNVYYTFHNIIHYFKSTIMCIFDIVYTVSTWMYNIIPNTVHYLKVIVASIYTLLQNMTIGIFNITRDIINFVGTLLYNIIFNTIYYLRELVNSLFSLLQNMIVGIFDIIRYYINNVYSIFNNFINRLRRSLDVICSFFKEIVHFGVDAVYSTFNSIYNAVVSVKNSILNLNDYIININKSAQNKRKKAETSILTVAYAINHDRTGNGIINVALKCWPEGLTFNKSMFKGVTIDAFSDKMCLDSSWKESLRGSIEQTLHKYMTNVISISSCMVETINVTQYMCE